MPTNELFYVVFFIVFSVLILAYLSLRVKSVIKEERDASEIIQGILIEINRRMKQQDMRILDQQIRLDIIDVKRRSLGVVRTRSEEPPSNTSHDSLLTQQFDNTKESRDVTSTELNILRSLNEGAKSPIEIQKIISLSREHVSRIMKEIYYKGLVSRETNERPYRYRLTHAGEKLIGANT